MLQAEAFLEFGRAAQRMGIAFRDFGRTMRLVMTPPNLRPQLERSWVRLDRRMQRDMARLHRRPALIHNGRKP